MSSLLQHPGRVTSKGVGLIMTLVKSAEPGTDGYAEPVHERWCDVCSKHHEQLYEVFRKPVGMLGQWVLFHYNGERHAPDLSVPIMVTKLPRGAREFSSYEAENYWHADERGAR